MTERHHDLGIIGGLGPLAGSYFSLRLTELEDAGRDQDHLESVLIQACRTPDRTSALLEGGESPVRALSEALQELIDLGCPRYCIVCNTAHAFVPLLRYQGEIAFISMITAAEDEAFAKSHEVVLLSTTGTRAAGIYQDREEGAILLPSAENARALMDVIVSTKEKGVTDEALSGLSKVIGSEEIVHPGAGVLLSCTELSLYRSSLEQAFPTLVITDALDALARRAIRACHHKVKD